MLDIFKRMRTPVLPLKLSLSGARHDPKSLLFGHMVSGDFWPIFHNILNEHRHILHKIFPKIRIFFPILTIITRWKPTCEIEWLVIAPFLLQCQLPPTLTPYDPVGLIFAFNFFFFWNWKNKSYALAQKNLSPVLKPSFAPHCIAIIIV